MSSEEASGRAKETFGRETGGVGRPAPSAPPRAGALAERVHYFVVGGLLLVHAGLVISSLRHNFVTLDESAHVPAGLAHWRTGSFAAYRVNPPLGRMLAALPLLAADPVMPETLPPDAPGRRSEWDLSKQFADDNADRYVELFCLARWAGVAWSLLGGLLIYVWTRDLYGWAAGCLALALWCLDSNIIAHAQLVTPDIPAAVMALATCFLFWRYLRQPNWTRAWFVGLALGAALLTKFTLLLLYVILPALAAIFWWRRRLPGRWARLGQLALLFVLSGLVVNLGYGFEESGRRLGDFVFVSGMFGGDTAEKNRFHDTVWEDLLVPLPANYLTGIDVQRRDFESGWPFYLAGEWRAGGWWYFYLYALGVKLPLAIVILVLGGLGLRLFKGKQRGHDELALLLPPVAFLVLLSCQTGVQYARYALPLLPFLYVSAGCWLAVAGRGRWAARGVALVLVLWLLVSCWRIHPHHLSYFNELAGGPEGGAQHLVDSNLDWGQDLLFLKAWLDDHPEARPLGLAYFGSVDPRVLGIEFRLPPVLLENSRKLHPAGSPAPRPGWFAVSVHFIQGGPFVAPDGKGEWQRIPLHGFSYFRQFQPVARAGYGIYIYHLTPERIDEAR